MFYEKPIVEFKELHAVDVITASGNNGFGSLTAIDDGINLSNKAWEEGDVS